MQLPEISNRRDDLARLPANVLGGSGIGGQDGLIRIHLYFVKHKSVVA